MMYLRKNTIRFRKSNGRRGSVIVLVVAVLALLAVIGTVYIVSARSERAGATASNVAANLENAQEAVNDQLVHVIGAHVYDAQGILGGRAGGIVGPFGDRVGRRHDMPETNMLNFGYAEYDAEQHDQSWLVSNLYRPYRVGVPSRVFTDMSYPAARWPVKDTVTGATFFSPSVFNPATGAFDIYLLTYANGVPSFLPIFDDTPGNTRGLFRVVADSLPTGLTYPNGGSYAAGDDGFVQMLPFSEANGTRYRYAVRILDTSRMANLNVGMTFDMASGVALWQGSGTYLTSYSLVGSLTGSLAGLTFNPADASQRNYLKVNAGGVGPGNNGRQGMMSINTAVVPEEYAWLQAALRFENPEAVINGFPLNTLSFDLADELELRSYGSFGTLASPRAALAGLWPNTLANRPANSASVAGNMRRGHYTAYSWSRDLRPYSDPVNNMGASTAYELQPPAAWYAPPPSGPGSTLIWPMSPARVAANPDISEYTGMADPKQAADMLVTAAVNIATAMEKIANFPPEEARAFAANYIAFRWNSWRPQPVLKSTPAGAKLRAMLVKRKE